MVTQTSRIAYDHVVTEGKEISQSEFLTRLMIPNSDYSRMELSQRSGFPINVVTARVNKLIKDGRLIVGEQRRCFVTGHTINPVRLAPSN